jgi:hypothetical protein
MDAACIVLALSTGGDARMATSAAGVQRVRIPDSLATDVTLFDMRPEVLSNAAVASACTQPGPAALTVVRVRRSALPLQCGANARAQGVTVVVTRTELAVSASASTASRAYECVVVVLAHDGSAKCGCVGRTLTVPLAVVSATNAKGRTDGVADADDVDADVDGDGGTADDAVNSDAGVITTVMPLTAAGLNGGVFGQHASLVVAGMRCARLNILCVTTRAMAMLTLYAKLFMLDGAGVRRVLTASQRSTSFSEVQNVWRDEDTKAIERIMGGDVVQTPEVTGGCGDV